MYIHIHLFIYEYIEASFRVGRSDQKLRKNARKFCFDKISCGCMVLADSYKPVLDIIIEFVRYL